MLASARAGDGDAPVKKPGRGQRRMSVWLSRKYMEFGIISNNVIKSII